VGPVVVVEVLLFLELVVEDLGVVDHDAVQQAVEVLGVDAVGAFDLPLRRGVRGLMETCPAPWSRTCQWKLTPSSGPLSVWMTSTRNGCRCPPPRTRDCSPARWRPRIEAALAPH